MSERIKIEANIPIPKPRTQYKSWLDKLAVGQTFRVSIENWSALRNAAGNSNKKSNKKFTVRKVSEPVKKGGRTEREYARVWRTK